MEQDHELYCCDSDDYLAAGELMLVASTVYENFGRDTSLSEDSYQNVLEYYFEK